VGNCPNTGYKKKMLFVAFIVRGKFYSKKNKQKEIKFSYYLFLGNKEWKRTLLNYKG
jgi:hypothetical protein